jgi:quercetin dioxygenase-like cupin family protein
MTDEPADKPCFRAFEPGYRWAGTDLLAYKEEGSAPFRSVTRQTLFQDARLGCELRYFEVAPGGWSTLERHEHMHAVMILGGKGECLIDSAVHAVAAHDLVTIPPWTWHQFRAAPDSPLGFLCMVNRERDKPQLPSEADRAELAAVPAVAAFLGL